MIWGISLAFWEITPSYCPGCGLNYCRREWDTSVLSDNGLYDGSIWPHRDGLTWDGRSARQPGVLLAATKVELFEQVRRDSRRRGLSVRALAAKWVHPGLVREALPRAEPALRKYRSGGWRGWLAGRLDGVAGSVGDGLLRAVLELGFVEPL